VQRAPRCTAFYCRLWFSVDRDRKPRKIVRKSLIAKGLVYSTARGELIFAVPRMADYIARNYQPAPPPLSATI